MDQYFEILSASPLFTGMSREKIDHHHEGTASRVSIGLMDENALAAIFRRHLHLTVKISDDRMYQVTGKRI